MLDAAQARVRPAGRGANRRSFRERWFEFARHLHDLCKRIILREAKYAGTYQSSTNTWKGEYAVDRVTPTMTVKDLGFSQVPTHI
jgi:hypothetical protein